MNTPRKSAQRLERLEARVTSAQKKLIERAAQLRETSVTDFIVSTMQQVATEAIREHETMTLRDQDREIFINALLTPLQPNKTAKTAAALYRKKQGL